ncbi:MAG TPA: isoprenylcysteine carboxylmethyltransferase family protein [Nitrospinaceae bacterium]|jgi:protein-S-isoprenylcysteine O-methyltransferase Ste14|nr:isoprenylcysteine carboxylmethyltransferase family protein [Nitrospinaceae bacterium]MDP7108800.1 isoprenylcysteine carboxylmethyltransferase family protein [Nitrospinaceae bacterium]HJL72303.1 isoprenylcysteine carboxylmethyltransferase family protein [Nitrospinaceae bacterium]HJN99542.1 isoprenylcysteine carboxylmethyltransferase family protein [Nitrospinaceae bacterium]|tara:strand:- start:2126 stop:2584 length:459 start_codon:yes stop_codon:yes gene_type:complete
MFNSKNLTSNQRFLLDIAIPSLYLLPLLIVFFLPKNFGFGNEDLVPYSLLIGLTGLALWIAGMACLGQALRVLPGADSIVARGVYRFIRHPIYVGIVFTHFGLFFACGSTFGMIYLFALIVPMNVIRAQLEEKAMFAKFGNQYRSYRDSTWL